MGNMMISCHCLIVEIFEVLVTIIGLMIALFYFRIESNHEVTILGGLNEFIVKFFGPKESKFDFILQIMDYLSLIYSYLVQIFKIKIADFSISISIYAIQKTILDPEFTRWGP